MSLEYSSLKKTAAIKIQSYYKKYNNNKLKNYNFPRGFIEKSIIKYLDNINQFHIKPQVIKDDIYFEKNIIEKYNNLSKKFKTGAAKLLYEDIFYLIKFSNNENYIKLLRKLGPIISLLTYFTCLKENPSYYSLIIKIMKFHKISFNTIEKFL